MMRFVVTLLVGLGLGAGLGLYLGWERFPVEFTDSPATALDERYQDDYTVMIATAYRTERDTQAALERLRLLGAENIPQFVQEVTERAISNSHDPREIGHLVLLAEALGRLTPLMQPYRGMEGG